MSTLILQHRWHAAVVPCTDSPAQLVCQAPGIANNIGGDAVELPVIVNLSNQELTLQLGTELVSGPAPGLLKYVWYDLGAAALIVDTFDAAEATIVARIAGLDASALFMIAACRSTLMPCPTILPSCNGCCARWSPRRRSRTRRYPPRTTSCAC